MQTTKMTAHCIKFHEINKQQIYGLNPKITDSQGWARAEMSASPVSPVVLESFCGVLTSAAKVKELTNLSHEVLLSWLVLLGRAS